ncbi:CPBP family intramembrane metalloprotease [Leucobacter triazinivorans]|uniref:CPBP family intramembrane metalloprotease n=1 Tax=Leucobacter triazinivorans TaxID=1784719 RepID=A0A4P6KEI9_9MICO|nr:CPBP family intramembrane metalloprotease [Leucobacter triazinivorans]
MSEVTDSVTHMQPQKIETAPGSPRADRPERGVPWGAVALFVALAYGGAWLVALPLWLMGPDAPAFPVVFGLLAMAMMLTPAIAALVVTFVARVPRRERLRFLGIWPLRPAKRVVWFTIGALFAPLLIGALTTLLAALLGWVRIDPVHLSGFAEINAAALPENMDPSVLPSPWVLVAVQLALFPVLAILPNSIVGFGEELGWRGWLLPALRPLGLWPALLLSGAIWGLWHAPLTLLGHNYGLMDWRGVALMTINCTILGVLFGWLRLRTGSVWPATIGHGALNGTGGMIMWFVAAGETVRPELVTVAGVAGWIVCGALILILALTGQLRKEPELARSIDGTRSTQTASPAPRDGGLDR